MENEPTQENEVEYLDENADAANEGGGGNGRKKKKSKSAAGKKKKKAAGGGDGRSGRRGPSEQTVKKQLWVIQQLQSNPNLTLHELMQMVRDQFDTMLSFDRTKEAKAAFEAGSKAIEQLKEGKFQVSGGGGGRGKRSATLSGRDAPAFMIASKKRARWQFESVDNEREANRRVQELLAEGDSPAVYRRVDLKVDVRIAQ